MLTRSCFCIAFRACAGSMGHWAATHRKPDIMHAVREHPSKYVQVNCSVDMLQTPASALSGTLQASGATWAGRCGRQETRVHAYLRVRHFRRPPVGLVPQDEAEENGLHRRLEGERLSRRGQSGEIALDPLTTLSFAPGNALFQGDCDGANPILPTPSKTFYSCRPRDRQPKQKMYKGVKT